MKTVKDLKEFCKRYFPKALVDTDGSEIIIHTGLTEDPVSRQLADADMDEFGSTEDDSEPEFGRYRD